MTLFKEILQLKLPHWESVEYKNVKFVKIELLQQSREYSYIYNSLQDICNINRPMKITRIQHPFAYARFEIKREQIILQTGYEPLIRRVFVNIFNIKMLDHILECNCDIRLHNLGYIQWDRFCNNITGVFVIMRVLEKLCLPGFPEERDTDYFPEYLIEFGPFTFNKKNESSDYKNIENSSLPTQVIHPVEPPASTLSRKRHFVCANAVAVIPNKRIKYSEMECISQPLNYNRFNYFTGNDFYRDYTRL